jgi:hypothetical protein
MPSDGVADTASGVGWIYRRDTTMLLCPAIRMMVKASTPDSPSLVSIVWRISGRRYDSKDTTGSYRQLDVRRLQRDGALVDGRFSAQRWSRDGEVTASINFIMKPSGLTLSYRQRSPGEDWKQMEYTVGIEWPPCNYGGERAWFRCRREDAGDE